MLNNNISNKGATIIGVALKDLLIVDEEKNIKNFFKKIFSKPSYKLEVDKLRVIRRHYLQSDYNFEIVCDNFLWNLLDRDLKDEINRTFLNVVLVEDYKEVTANLHEGIYKYFVTDDRYIDEMIGHSCCIKYSYINTLIRIGVKL